MRHGTYVGKDSRLYGKTALIRDDPITKEFGNSFPLQLAQFDDTELEEAFGWHLFNRSDFIEDEDNATYFDGELK